MRGLLPAVEPVRRAVDSRRFIASVGANVGVRSPLCQKAQKRLRSVRLVDVRIKFGSRGTRLTDLPQHSVHWRQVSTGVYLKLASHQTARAQVNIRRMGPSACWKTM